MMKVELLYFKHNCNSYLLYNDKNNECFIVDPGFNENNCLINSIKKRNLIIKGFLLTHGHYDHIMGLLNIDNTIPVYVYKGEEEFLVNPRYNCSIMGMEGGFVVTNRKIINFEDNDILRILGEEIKIIHTPFHTSGSVCFYIPNMNILITGDTLFYHAIGRTDLPTSSNKLINHSLKKVFSLPHEDDLNTKVFPGHGPSTTLSREYRFFKNEYNL